MTRLHNHPRFGIRSTAVILDRGRVLGHRPADVAGDDWWALPGGGPEFRESMADAVVRELDEELCVAGTVDRLLYVIEHLYGSGVHESHGIDFVHLVDVPRDWRYRDTDEFVSDGEEAYGRLLQRWLPLTPEGLARLYPECLRTLLLEPELPQTPRHVFYRETNASASTQNPAENAPGS